MLPRHDPVDLVVPGLRRSPAVAVVREKIERAVRSFDNVSKSAVFALPIVSGNPPAVVKPDIVDDDAVIRAGKRGKRETDEAGSHGPRISSFPSDLGLLPQCSNAVLLNELPDSSGAGYLVLQLPCG